MSVVVMNITVGSVKFVRPRRGMVRSQVEQASPEGG
jgi:hypothetical protein